MREFINIIIKEEGLRKIREIDLKINELLSTGKSSELREYEKLDAIESLKVERSKVIKDYNLE
jgi:hypothetical protein